METKIKAKRPFTEFVPGKGMVVFNTGDVRPLPADAAQRRVDSGAAELAKSATETPVERTTQREEGAANAKREAKRRKRPSRARKAAPKRTAAKPEKAAKPAVNGASGEEAPAA